VVGPNPATIRKKKMIWIRVTWFVKLFCIAIFMGVEEEELTMANSLQG